MGNVSKNIISGHVRKRRRRRRKMDKMNQPCRNCGRTLTQLLLLAMMEDAGAKVYPSSGSCEHEFPDSLPDEPKEKKDAG